MQNKALKTKLAKKKDSPPRGKFTNRFKQSPQDFVQTETISVNGWGEELDQPVAQHPIAFLGNLEPSDTGLHQVQDVGGYCWKPVSSIVDSGAINSVAPPDVSSVPMTESQGSVNGMQYHTADGTRIPNLGQKTFDAVSEQGSALSPNVSHRRHLSAADLSGRVGGCGQCSGCLVGKVAMFSTLILGDGWTSKENTVCTCFALGSRRRAKLGFGRQG